MTLRLIFIEFKKVKTNIEINRIRYSLNILGFSSVSNFINKKIKKNTVFINLNPPLPIRKSNVRH